LAFDSITVSFTEGRWISVALVTCTTLTSPEITMKIEMQSVNLLLVFIYSLSLLLVGCAIGMHWRGSPSIAICTTILGATLFVLHELMTVLLWFHTIAYWNRMMTKGGK
jgi:hypothetical protein